MVSEFSFLGINYFVPFHFFSIGPRYVLMNHHMLLHMKKNMSDHGPIESSSLFVFEDWNGDIGNFHGTQNIANQVKLHPYDILIWHQFLYCFGT